MATAHGLENILGDVVVPLDFHAQICIWVKSVSQSLSQSVTQSSSSCLASLSISPLVAWSNFEKIPPVGKWRARAVLITWWSSATIVEPAVVYSSTPASMRRRVEPGGGVASLRRTAAAAARKPRRGPRKLGLVVLRSPLAWWMMTAAATVRSAKA